jgi:hypothetical protein
MALPIALLLRSDCRAYERALNTAIDTISSHCSCVAAPGKRLRHAKDCFVRLHSLDLLRLMSLRVLLRDEGKK